MKIGEGLKFEDGKILHQEAWDPNVGLDDAQKAREAKEMSGGKLLDFVGGHIGEPQYSYPMWLEQLWSQQWKVSMDDPAFEDIVQMELASGQYERFRL